MDVAELVLFKFHLHGRGDLDVLVHTLLLILIAGCIVATLTEYKFSANPLAAYTRAWMVLLQGTWFIQVGFILYPPLPFMLHWEQEDHQQMMLATMMFTWHMAADTILVFLISALSRSCYRRWCFVGSGSLEWEMAGVGQLPTAGSKQANGGLYLTLQEEVSEEEEKEEDTVLYLYKDNQNTVVIGEK